MSGKKPTLGQAAVGLRDGDTLELRNQWAHVTITVWADDSDRPTCKPSYVCTGDLANLRIERKEFPTMGAAITYALRSLALYQEGRAN